MVLLGASFWGMSQFEAHYVFHQKHQAKYIKEANVNAVFSFTIITKERIILDAVN